MSSKDEQSLAAAVAEVTAAARVSGMPDINELQDARAALAREDRAPLPIGVLLSGSGTNLQALIDAIDAGALNADIKLVVGSRPSAFGLKRAEAAGIQTLTLSKEIYADPRSLPMSCLRQAASTWLWPVTCAWFTPHCSPRSPIA